MIWRIALYVLGATAWLVSTYIFGAQPSCKNQGYGLLCMVIYTLLLIFSAVNTPALRKRYRALGLLPLLIMLGSCVASIPVRSLGFDTRIDRFKASQSKYDEIVSKVLSRDIPDPVRDKDITLGRQDGYVAFHTPEKYRELVPYLIAVDRKGTNTVAIRLVLCVTFPSHHQTYLWCPDGRFEDRLRTWEHIQAVINTNWCAIAD